MLNPRPFLPTPRARGFSLVEVLVAAALSLTLLASALHLHGLNARTLNLLEQERLLGATLDQVTHLVLAEARRAGFRAGGGPPWRVRGALLRIGAAEDAPEASCLLYAYDRDGDGLRGVGREGRGGPGRDRDNVEEFGFRLRQGRLQIRQGGRTHDCRAGRWMDLTPPEIRVTGLRFALQRQPDGSQRLRLHLEIALDGLRRRLETGTWLPNA